MLNGMAEIEGRQSHVRMLDACSSVVFFSYPTRLTCHSNKYDRNVCVTHIRTLTYHILSTILLPSRKERKNVPFISAQKTVSPGGTHKKIMTFASEYGNVISITCTHTASAEPRVRRKRKWKHEKTFKVEKYIFKM